MTITLCLLCSGDYVGPTDERGECESCSVCSDCGEPRNGFRSEEADVTRRCERCHEENVARHAEEIRDYQQKDHQP